MELTQSLEDLVRQLPALPPIPQKNFFDITGIRNKEVINSRVLGYFLTPKEEHGLDTLFFQSLLDLIREKSAKLPDVDLESYSGPFTVEEEEPTLNAVDDTDQRKRIDLVLKGHDWAIIIENKLYHDVINPLGIYWDHLKEYKHKIGIILSLFDVRADKYNAPGFTFINITHQSLINKISHNFRFDAGLSEISLFYLKEYFKTIQSHYAAKQNAPEMNEIVNKLIEQKDNVNLVLKKLDEANKFVVNQVAETLENHKFKSTNGLGNPARLFFSCESAKSIVVAVNTDRLLTENKFIVHLALMSNEVSVEVAGELKNLARAHVAALSWPNLIPGSYSGKEHTHLLVYTDVSFLNQNENFGEKFNQLFTNLLLGANGLVDQMRSHLVAGG